MLKNAHVFFHLLPNMVTSNSTLGFDTIICLILNGQETRQVIAIIHLTLCQLSGSANATRPNHGQPEFRNHLRFLQVFISSSLPKPRW